MAFTINIKSFAFLSQPQRTIQVQLGGINGTRFRRHTCSGGLREGYVSLSFVLRGGGEVAETGIDVR